MSSAASPSPSAPASATSSHSIAPAQVLRGSGAWSEAVPLIAGLGTRVLLLGRSVATAGLRQSLADDLAANGLAVRQLALRHDCCAEDLQRLEAEARSTDADLLLAAGGGKVLDAGKLLAQRLVLPCVTVPTSAATCAGWTALSNLYSPQGAFQGDVALDRCPDLLVFDHDLVRQASPRTLVSGIADAMAKWYEASVSSGGSHDGLIQQTVQMARVLRDQLLLDAEAALGEPGGEAWVRVAEACALTAGLIGGLGGARCRTVAAHAVHNGLTQLAACHGSLHGEKVGFGVLVQLRLEELVGGQQLAAQARRQLLPLFQRLGIPCTLAELGLAQASLSDLEAVCAHACAPGSDLHHLPFPVHQADLLAAMVSTTSAPIPSPERQPA
ncbi:MAG: iron-containing alcohol dehydrogenase family protein [Cyanobium sp. PLM2.Bin73]|nr:MAG: iron-containing alcohol dehydrogenase family protein [Cyanobium sp. PLM2.Bin73]